MIHEQQLRTAVGILGNIISCCLYASAIPTIRRILKNKDVEDFLPDPYLAMIMNNLLWIFYGLPIVHPNSNLVISINAIGVVVESIYLCIFLRYGTKKHWLRIGGVIALEIIITGIVAAITLTKFHTFEKRSFFVGFFCVGFGIIMYSSPLTIMKKVVTTKSVEFMPFPISLLSFINGCVWTIYGLLVKLDYFILGSNGTGALVGLVQLILYGIYWKKTPKKGAADGKQRSEVQLENVV